ncbi:PilX N-terminal domain-containing pilus assembly protein [Janthinobacterium sp. 17J80-10]|uniref:pilus assembly PilX family protein n=1 Tax=Janthinobacterium sp. 17J80-10 TaxID=2497863 RepID=UPI0010056B06|nr:PilX N-terminal domain-containing pilus assembly protein [Janthinobacterium sp. 17J80-10]QAU35238.1 pilus assembly protein [Janthinobacterium sp. 17J80-10]
MSRHSRGAALVVALLMLMVILMLGIAASQSALQGLKTTRNDGDRQVALQAAEAALRDAEMDIEQSPDAGKSRSSIFSRRSSLGFPAHGETGCNGGAANIYLGLCRQAGMNALPVWQTVEFGEDAATVQTVAFGTFTGQSLQVGKGALPSRLPRYIIELFSYKRPGESADKVSYFYRITAVGFGARESTQVALQSFYRKEDE